MIELLKEVVRVLLRIVFYICLWSATALLGVVWLIYWALAGEKLDLFPIIRPVHTGMAPPEPGEPEPADEKHPDRPRKIGGRPSLGRSLSMDEFLDEYEREEPF